MTMDDRKMIDRGFELGFFEEYKAPTSMEVLETLDSLDKKRYIMLTVKRINTMNKLREFLTKEY